MSDEGKPLQPEHVIKRVVWRGVISISGPMERSTSWTIAAVGAITGLLLNNYHAVVVATGIGAMKAAILLLAGSLIAGAMSKLGGMVLPAGLQMLREIDATLATEPHRQLILQMGKTPQKFVEEISEPFLWPMAGYMRRSGEKGIKDYLAADKRLVRMFCGQLYLHAFHLLLAFAALVVLAWSIELPTP